MSFMTVCNYAKAACTHPIVTHTAAGALGGGVVGCIGGYVGPLLGSCGMLQEERLLEYAKNGAELGIYIGGTAGFASKVGVIGIRMLITKIWK